MLIEVQGKMDAVQYYEILDKGALKVWRWLRIGGTFNSTMTQNIPQKRQNSGFLIITSFP